MPDGRGDSRIVLKICENFRSFALIVRKHFAFWVGGEEKRREEKRIEPNYAVWDLQNLLKTALLHLHLHSFVFFFPLFIFIFGFDLPLVLPKVIPTFFHHSSPL